MSTDISVERATPEEVFALLGNETRMGILQGLLETPNEVVGFAELRKRVGERDSGKFNYHLSKLLDKFVRKDEDGYELTLAGRQVVGAVLSGGYTTSVELEPIEIDAPCEECGGQYEALYEDERVTVQCAECGQLANRHTFPPGTIEQFEHEELPAAFDRWLNADFGRILTGFCPNCSGRMHRSLVSPDDVDALEGVPEQAVAAKFDCGRCGTTAHGTAVLPLLYHPAGVSFFWDHGIDVRATPSWELASKADWYVDSATEDYSSARVVLEIDGDELRATIDDSLEISDVERNS